MSESQSRYSIVETLTERKLEIITEKSNLDEELKGKQQEVEKLKKDLLDWEKDIQKDNERTKRLKQREIEQAEISHENAKQRKNTREKAFDEQINAIESALQRIEEISKTSPTNQP
jgi:Skp family chaperone for outer membrane proteins